MPLAMRIVWHLPISRSARCCVIQNRKSRHGPVALVVGFVRVFRHISETSLLEKFLCATDFAYFSHPHFDDVDKLKAELHGTLAEVLGRPVDTVLLVGLAPVLHVFLAAGDQHADQASQLASGCGDRDGRVLSGDGRTMIGTDECLAVPGRHGSHAQGLRELVDHLGRAFRLGFAVIRHSLTRFPCQANPNLE